MTDIEQPGRPSNQGRNHWKQARVSSEGTVVVTGVAPLTRGGIIGNSPAYSQRCYRWDVAPLTRGGIIGNLPQTLILFNCGFSRPSNQGRNHWKLVLGGFWGVGR